MTMLSDWRRVVRRAWSFRLVVVAALLSGCEVVIPLFVDAMPRNVFTGLALSATVAAAIARVVAQDQSK